MLSDIESEDMKEEVHQSGKALTPIKLVRRCVREESSSGRGVHGWTDGRVKMRQQSLRRLNVQ